MAKRLLVATLSLTALPLAAQTTTSLKNHNANAPVDFAADRIELQDRTDRAILTGNVEVKQGDMTLRAARVTINYSSAAQTQVNRMDASGSVVLTTATETARSQYAIYDLRTRLVTMIGGVTVSRAGKGETKGNRLVINMNSGLASLDGGAAGSGGGRVTGRFTPPPRSQN
ncbi:LptA/OstA family protein [Rhizorhabdus phycosphaerae]|uniref:LptA/OstA family protein n=1 Tax=Rhizorhabdus phycosphaerae TaxID=2711156 RepID=UPI0013EAB4AC|nr:LptA/OstA family protein [Rhizorhabdus phycosphaerae]